MQSLSRSTNRRLQIAVMAVAVAVALVVGVQKSGGLNLNSGNLPGVDVLASEIQTRSGETTTTVIHLDNRSYTAGDCIIWDDTPGSKESRITRVVPCDKEHYFQYVSHQKVDVTGEYPSDLKWDEIFKSECRQDVDNFLGYRLDDYGRFYVTAIHPSPLGWNDYDRELKCGISMKSLESSSIEMQRHPFSFDVRGADQAFLYPDKSCVLSKGEHESGVVPCDQSHHYEVTGTIDLKDLKAFPQNDDQWWKAIDSKCKKLATDYFGGKIPVGVEHSYFGMEQSSWDVGTRKTNCSVALFEGGKAVPVTGKLADRK